MLHNTTTPSAGYRKKIISKVVRFRRNRSIVRRIGTKPVTQRTIDGLEECIKIVDDDLQDELVRKQFDKRQAVCQLEQRTHGFIHLPRELRNKVYDHLLDEMPTNTTLSAERYCSPYTYLPRNTLPSLAFTSHDIFDEVVPAFIRRTKLMVACPTYQQAPMLYAFLSHFRNEEAFRSIRRLEYLDHLDHFSSREARYNDDPLGRDIASVAMRCPGLQQLTLGISASSLVVRNHAYDYNDSPPKMVIRYERLKTPEELEEEMRLTHILDHSGAFVLRLVFRHIPRVTKQLHISSADLLNGYMKAFHVCRARKRSKIQLEVEHDGLVV